MVQCGCPGLEERWYSAFLRIRRTCTRCPRFRRPWKAWWGQHISHQWISSQASGKLRWPQVCNSTWPSQWVTLGSSSLPTCHSGLCNAPATFQHLMQNTLGELNLTYCVTYLDDIVFGHTEEEHLKCLRCSRGSRSSI